MKITKVAMLILAIAIALYVVFPDLSWAEESVSPQSLPTAISGTVLDPTDNTLAGATVVLQGPGSSDRYTALSNDNGSFEFHGLKSGIPYRVTVHAKGFADWTSSALVLDPGQYKILTDCKLELPDVQTTINVGYSSVEVATEQVKAAEKQRVLGIAPNFYAVYDRNPEPLTAKLKFELALKTAVDPVTIFGVALVAGLDQAGNTPNYQQGAKGYGQRFGAVAGGAFSDTLIGGAILPSLLHQDPRYFYQGTGTTKSRILHALSHPFVCKGDNGRWQPNYSSIGGDLAASALENAYYPQSNRGASLVFGHFALDTAERAVSSLAQEFLLRKLTPKAKDVNETFQN
ncbi:MAG: carboxypeptidase-like regulatory domain-containing protein [Candidatus Korobacteraceae bacterium]